MYIPSRSHFIRIDFDPQAGHEQMGNRPALVVSHSQFNQKMGFAVVCPISKTKRQNPFYVKIPQGLKVKGVVMADQVRSLDFRARKATFICDCPNLLIEDVLRRIKPILF
jgi:mRNA interferase MazF